MRETYNLPGYGLITYDLFPHARAVYDHLAGIGLVRRLKQTNQLGALREVLPGAHHTRFEYVMAQLAMITELCYLKGHQPAGLHLGSRRNSFGRLPGMGKDPSNGEILQILTLLTNVGHVSSTFSGERAFVHYLRRNRLARNAFRRGLLRDDRKYCDDVLDGFRIYNVSNLIALFLLNRYRRREHGNEVADFCHAIMRCYIRARSEPDQALIVLWQLFRSIRRLTYLALDCLYTPVPFSLDLASIFLSLEHYLEEVFAFQSGFQEALSRLEGVMRDSIYLSAPCLVQHARAASFALSQLQSHAGNVTTISGLRDVLGPTVQAEQVFGWDNDPVDANREHFVVLSYSCDPAVSGLVLDDTVAWEQTVRRRVGLRDCYCGAEWDPLRAHLRVAGAVRTSPSEERRAGAALKLAKQLVDLEQRVDKVITRGEQARWENGRALLHFLLKAFFGWNHLYRMRPFPVTGQSPVILGSGTTNLAKSVASYIAAHRASAGATPDRLHELEMLRRTLEIIPYRGLALAYAGSAEVVGQNRVLTEFDGVVFLLGKASPLGSAVVVEGKNLQHGHTEGRRQLKERLGQLGLTAARFELHDIGTRGAYATIESR